MTCRSTCGTCCLAYAWCVIVILVAVIGVSIFGVIKGPSAVNDIVEKKISSVLDEMMVLSPTTELFQNWASPTLLVPYQKFYFFDVQNAEDVLNSGAKPRLVERGPYTYRFNVVRYNITFGANDTLSFRLFTWLEFVPELSNGYENDSITTVNMALAATVSGAKYKDWFSRLAVSAVAGIHGHRMFTTLTVGELLWGFEDPMLKQMQDLVGKETVPTATIGLLLDKNGSDVSATVNTGASDPMLLNQMEEFYGRTKFRLWRTDEANAINGTDGSFFHPGMSEDETVYVFNPMRCRSVSYQYQASQMHYDIPMLKYHIPPEIYANASRNPSNADFCWTDTCPDGILNTTACTKGPIGMSLPHFLYASPDIIDAFDGIEPNATKHDSYVLVEPRTGMAYQQRRRLQMSIYMEPVDGISETYGIRPMYYPLCWTEMSVDYPEDIANMFRDRMSIVDGLDDIVFYAFIGLAAFCFILIILILLCVITKCCKKKKGVDYSKVSTHVRVATTKDPDINSKTYSKGIPKNIYVQLPGDENGTKADPNTSDEPDTSPYEPDRLDSSSSSLYEQILELVTDSTGVLSAETEYRTDDELGDGAEKVTVQCEDRDTKCPVDDADGGLESTVLADGQDAECRTANDEEELYDNSADDQETGCRTANDKELDGTSAESGVGLLSEDRDNDYRAVNEIDSSGSGAESTVLSDAASDAHERDEYKTVDEMNENGEEVVWKLHAGEAKIIQSAIETEV